MGAWGYGLYDNDTAADAEFVLKEMSDQDLKGLTNMGWLLDYSESVFAVGDYQIRRFGKITKEYFDKFEEYYETELNLLNDWRHPYERERFLVGLFRRFSSYLTE